MDEAIKPRESTRIELLETCRMSAIESLTEMVRLLASLDNNERQDAPFCIEVEMLKAARSLAVLAGVQ